MAEMRIEAEREIGAPADRVYGVIADYQRHHPKFLPPAFSDYRVESGGVGAGTVVSFRLKVGGRSQAYRSDIAEPDPGRVLTERDRATGALTTFTVTPAGTGSRVRIETVWQGASGVAGWIERLLAPRLLGELYADELTHLDHYARQQ